MDDLNWRAPEEKEAYALFTNGLSKGPEDEHNFDKFDEQDAEVLHIKEKEEKLRDYEIYEYNKFLRRVQHRNPKLFLAVVIIGGVGRLSWKLLKNIGCSIQRLIRRI